MTLDELWVDAEKLGRVQLEQSSHGAQEYSASISFSTPAGSGIYARGKAKGPAAALSAAIREARSLKAGYEFAAAT